ncbi:hypothetical protein FNV43_RR18397 [Rhamnella rubrinervis]|uniref:Uncharacterized protein n=1 Tax=Rhamnella rubrinervis TaxID=2594499 RepID=A0A8K0E676_9ROSA|nr:hypothetical protein FNV43_RR18397 [Rhamnella rubrinervis]
MEEFRLSIIFVYFVDLVTGKIKSLKSGHTPPVKYFVRKDSFSIWGGSLGLMGICIISCTCRRKRGQFLRLFCSNQPALALSCFERHRKPPTAAY